MPFDLRLKEVLKLGAIDVLNYNNEVGEILGISSANHFSCFEKKEFNNNTLTKHIKFVYDGFKLIAEFDVLNSDELTAKYLWAEDNLLTLIKDNASYYYMVDGNKNIVGLVDETATKVNTYEYTPFGKLKSETETVSNPFKFSSEYHDTETGLIYYNYRYYNPETGKWLKRDPIEEEGGINIYNFINNNPINGWDHLGFGLIPDYVNARKAAISGDWDAHEYFRKRALNWHKNVDSKSFSEILTKEVESRLGSIPNIPVDLGGINGTLLWIPTAIGANKVFYVVEVAAKKCKNDDGTYGALILINASITGRLGAGFAAQGNQNIKHNKYGQLGRKYRYRKNKGKNKANEIALPPKNKNFEKKKLDFLYETGDCDPCKNDINGGVKLKLGADAGVVVGVSAYVGGEFSFNDPYKFIYGFKIGVNNTIGAEAYVQAEGFFEGKFVIFNNKNKEKKK